MNAVAQIETLRVPPHSVDSECAVLGGLMLDERALGKVVDFLTEADFYRKDHRLIYRAICDLATQGKPCDAVTLGEWFESNGLADQVGGAKYVIGLANQTPGASNVAAYADIVKEKARLRELIELGTSMASEAFDPRNKGSSAIASTASNAISGLVGDARGGGLAKIGSALTRWWKRLQERFDNHETMTGVETPFAKLNELTAGLQSGDVIIVAGRPSMGKTVFGVEIATHAAVVNWQSTAMFSLEMRAEAITQRQVASIARVQHSHLRRPHLLTDDEWTRVTAAIVKINKAPLYIDDQPNLSALQIVARAKRQHLRTPIKLMVVDHLHEMRIPGKDRVNELGDAARSLRTLARECGFPIVLLVQLNRANTARTDHKPTLGDLRGSGSIEEVADIVALIHREDYYTPSTHLRGVVEVILAKGRDLPAGMSIYLENHYDQMRLADWIGDLPMPPEQIHAPRKGLRASGRTRMFNETDRDAN